MIESRTCLKCGRGPAGAGGICIDCSLQENLQKMLDETKNSFGLTAKISQANDKSESLKDIIPKDSYSLNPITRENAIKNKSSRTNSNISIDGLLSPNYKSSTTRIASAKYEKNPNVEGYISNFSRKSDNNYIFNINGYIIRLTDSGFNKAPSKSYGPSNSSYFSASSYSGDSKYAGSSAPKYGIASSISSSYSGKSSSNASSGGKK